MRAFGTVAVLFENIPMHVCAAILQRGASLKATSFRAA
jgi:hypothetical protein